MKRKVISNKSLPTHVPLWSSIVLYLLLDRISAPEWVWASVGTLWGLFFVTSIVMLFTQEAVDMFPSQPKEKYGGPKQAKGERGRGSATTSRRSNWRALSFVTTTQALYPPITHLPNRCPQCLLLSIVGGANQERLSI